MTDVSMWMALESAMQQDGKHRRSVSRDTLRRVAAFARPHLRTIVTFLVLATGSAVLGVAAPVLAGRAVDAIVEHRPTGTVVGLAVLIGAIALVDAVRRAARTAPVVTARRRSHPRPAPAGVRTRAKHADRVLHADPHRGARQPAQQRRDRGAAGVHLGAVRCGDELHRARPHGGGDAEPVVADHGAGTRAAADLRDPRPSGRRQGRCPRTRGHRAQRGDDVADDRTLLGAGRDIGQAVRTTGRRGATSSPAGPSASTTSGSARRWRWSCSFAR